MVAKNSDSNLPRGYTVAVVEGHPMSIHPLAGQPAPVEQLIDVDKLQQAYAERRSDIGDPHPLVSFGTSGHRGRPSDGTFTEAHVLAMTQAICDYRRTNGISGPLFMGKD